MLSVKNAGNGGTMRGRNYPVEDMIASEDIKSNEFVYLNKESYLTNLMPLDTSSGNAYYLGGDKLNGNMSIIYKIIDQILYISLVHRSNEKSQWIQEPWTATVISAYSPYTGIFRAADDTVVVLAGVSTTEPLTAYKVKVDVEKAEFDVSLIGSVDSKIISPLNGILYTIKETKSATYVGIIAGTTNTLLQCLKFNLETDTITVGTMLNLANCLNPNYDKVSMSEIVYMEEYVNELRSYSGITEYCTRFNTDDLTATLIRKKEFSNNDWRMEYNLFSDYRTRRFDDNLFIGFSCSGIIMETYSVDNVNGIVINTSNNTLSNTPSGILTFGNLNLWLSVNSFVKSSGGYAFSKNFLWHTLSSKDGTIYGTYEIGEILLDNETQFALSSNYKINDNLYLSYYNPNSSSAVVPCLYEKANMLSVSKTGEILLGVSAETRKKDEVIKIMMGV